MKHFTLSLLFVVSFVCLFDLAFPVFLCLVNSRLSVSGTFLVQVHCYDR